MTRRLQAAIVLLLMFVAGAYAGYRLAGSREDSLEKRMSRQPIPTENVALYEPLGLSPQQRDRIEAILTTARPGTGRMMDSIQERLRIRLDSIEASVRAVLEPGQLRMLDSLLDVGGLLPPGVKMRTREPPGR
jgi:hypothetical protein